MRVAVGKVLSTLDRVETVLKRRKKGLITLTFSDGTKKKVSAGDAVDMCCKPELGYTTMIQAVTGDPEDHGNGMIAELLNDLVKGD